MKFSQTAPSYPQMTFTILMRAHHKATLPPSLGPVTASVEADFGRDGKLVSTESESDFRQWIGALAAARAAFATVPPAAHVETRGFKQYLAEQERPKELGELLEHLTYKGIPGTSRSFREDPANTSTQTQQHAHVFAKANGGGKHLYAVNLNGTGHDGARGTLISARDAEFFRSRGYEIPSDNILESLEFEDIPLGEYQLFGIGA